MNKKLRPPAMGALLLFFTAYLTVADPGQPANPGSLVAAYGFDETAGAIVSDSSGHGNNGTIRGAVWSGAGKYGGSLAFSGSDWVTIGDSDSLDLTNGLTLEAWIKPSSPIANWSTVILKEQPGFLVYGLFAGSPGGHPSAAIVAPSLTVAEGVAAVSANVWSHLAATYEGAMLRLYVNGTQVASSSASGRIVVSTGALRIGGNSIWSEYFVGAIDEVRVYNRALSAGEIVADMNTPVAIATTGPPAITTNPTNVSVSLPPPVTATDLVEANLRGRLLHLHILGGAVPFPASGAFEIALAAGGNTYSIPAGGALPASTGHWSFGPDLGINAVLTLDSSMPGTGGPVKVALSPDGTYQMYAAGVVNKQHGTYGVTLLDGSAPGPTVTFTVAATGTPPLSYRWLRNGEPLNNGLVPAGAPLISGANTATLTIANVAGRNAGAYSCVISNAAGKVTSGSATLTVTGPPPPDVVPPTLAIAIPPASVTRVTSNSVHFAGTATDAGGIAGVSVRHGLGSIAPATGTTAWSASVGLEPGTNVIRFWARDLAGNNSLTNARTIVYTMTSPLTLEIHGFGSVKGATNGQRLEVDKAYSLTAVPGAGQAFSNWTGSGGVISPSAVLNFVMRPGLVLAARFVPIPFTGWAGSYNGLFHEDNGGVRHDASGFVNLALRSDGSFTASLRQGAQKYPFKGKFDLEGHFAGSVPRAGTSNVSVRLTLDLLGAEQITGRITDGSWDGTLLADRAKFNAATHPAADFAGTYTVLIPGSLDPGEPSGDGAGGFVVDAAGNVKLSGTLADGSPVTQKVPLGKGGAWPLYVSLYGGRGSLVGWIQISNTVPRALGGRVSWSRPPGATPKIYTNGFALDSLLIGSAYRSPGTNTIFNVTSAIVVFNQGDFPASFTNAVTLRPNGKVGAAGANKLTLTLVPTTGQFTGAMTPPGETRSLSFKGAILQKQGYGGGFFLGTNQSGRVYFGPL